MSAGIVLLYTLSGVATGYLKSIELTFVNLLIQGTLETILNMGKCGGSNIKATELGRNFDQKALWIGSSKMKALVMMDCERPSSIVEYKFYLTHWIEQYKIQAKSKPRIKKTTSIFDKIDSKNQVLQMKLSTYVLWRVVIKLIADFFSWIPNSIHNV